ncbi:hypothetical protein HID58_002614 [Brassica napus]|uniref:COP1-interacting protein 7 n=1 Tax=Brassica napus TaxID=3708 RepID=A0ABQ8EMT9_BRANA|nr:hypothetical protein HID58_002614 [Brassica napus]
MDSRAILDSALFQLTPTRTRFDLVLFCGSKKEKLASGIFEPFISHLKFARDQISKGGYSISLHPPTSHSSWFTKSTFDRFVRFVNTPAIIERFATLEKEILQIEHSIQDNEIANAEQLLQDGISFPIKASLEACVKYKELWKKKHGDGLWMAELAAVKAIAPEDMSLLGSSGIILTNEAAAAPLPLNGTHSGSENKDNQQASAVPNFQPPMGWPNHIPQYYYPPPYQGYPYPMMPGQNQGNMPWPAKGKASKKDESSGSSESSESDSASDDSASSLEDQGKRQSHTGKKKSRRSSKKNRKKASKTVIIRNINYITPEGRNGDMEGSEFTENGSIKDTVDTAVGFLKENRAYESDEILKSSAEGNENWDSFQNILMRQDDDEHVTHRGSKGLEENNNASGDSIVLTQKHIENGGGGARRFDQFESEESARRVSRTRDSTEECMLLPKRSEMLGDEESKDLYNAAARGGSLVKKSGSGEDWFATSDQRGVKPESNYGSMSFDESCIMMTSGGSDQSKKREFVDDSFMVRSSSLAGDDVYDSRWRPDMSADIDIDNGQANEKREVSGSWEPNDLCMIPERNSGEFLGNDHSIDFSVEANARLTSNGTGQEKEDKTVSSGEKKNNGKNPEARKSRTPEEEMRKRIENLVLERQRRIAERSAATASRKASNRAPKVVQ